MKNRSDKDEGPSGRRTQKINAYAQRQSLGEKVEISYDSDSDFRPGEYREPTPPPKGKKKKSKAAMRATVSALDQFLNRGKTSHSLKSRSIISRRPAVIGNPLEKWFGDLGLEVESDGPDDDEEFKEMEDEDDSDLLLSDVASGSKQVPMNVDDNLNRPLAVDESATEEESDSPSSLPPILKRKASESFDRDSDAKRNRTQPSGNGSTTEEDSDWIPDSSMVQRPPPAQSGSGNRSQKLPETRPESDDDSATEEESDSWLPAPKPTQRNDDSETESEDDDYKELLASGSKHEHPKPAFPLAPGQERLGPLHLDEGAGIKIPATINTYMRPYQREGVKFMYERIKSGRGGLLGDDMGLGKTIQIIALLSALMKKTGCIGDKNRRYKWVNRLMDGEEWVKYRRLPAPNSTFATAIIIVPKVVLGQWQKELETWGYFEVGLYYGKAEERDNVLHDFKLGRIDVLLTSFDIARTNIESLQDLDFSVVIVDEVHRVKSLDTSTSKALHNFKCKARIGLTGTAIQNSYNEFWSILDWTNPGQLGTLKQWKSYVARPLVLGQSTKATNEERERMDKVKNILHDKCLPNFFLRRTKDIIKHQLPKKIDRVAFCPLAPVQRLVYKNIVASDDVQNLINRDKPCNCGSRKTRKHCCHPYNPAHLFKYISILIKLSNHLALILPGSPTDTPEQVTRNRELAKIAFPDGAPKYGTAKLEESFCGKWAVLKTLLEEWRKDKSNKVLIFTKSVKLLEILQHYLEICSYGYRKLDGSTKQSSRMDLIDEFYTDPDVFIFLISTLAGGTGLNLTGANNVVIFDPNWNPAHDLQAMDRAFRIGQTRDVSVYRLLGAGSVEELIYARQIYKQQMMAIGYEASVQTRYFSAVQGDASKQGELFGLENMFSLHEDKLVTKQAIEDANLAQLDWALANFGGGNKKLAPKATKELYEAEAKVGKEDASMRGIAALLLDEVPTKPQDELQQKVAAAGVVYSHLNNELFNHSKIEEERSKRTKQLKRRQSKKGKEKEEVVNTVTKPAAQWPPLRVHGKAKERLKEQGRMRIEEAKQKAQSNSGAQKKELLDPLMARQREMVESGVVKDISEVPEFAKKFASYSFEEQQEAIQFLDIWIAEHPNGLVSESESETSGDDGHEAPQPDRRRDPAGDYEWDF